MIIVIIITIIIAIIIIIIIIALVAIIIVIIIIAIIIITVVIILVAITTNKRGSAALPPCPEPLLRLAHDIRLPLPSSPTSATHGRQEKKRTRYQPPHHRTVTPQASKGSNSTVEMPTTTKMC
jgi:hypothetical protein